MSLKTILALALLAGGASACSLLNKTAGKADNSSRSVAATGKYMESSQNFSQETARQKQALLRKIKQGKALISKAIALDDEGQPVCGIDVRNKQDLIPHFAKAAPAGFRSALAFKRGFPSCRPDLKRNLSQRVSQKGFVLEGTQTALAPLAMGAIAAGLSGSVGCGMGVFTTKSLKKAKAQDPLATIQQYNIGMLLTVLAGGSAGTGVSIFGAKTAAGVTGSGIIGMLSGAIGYIICGRIAYIVE